MLNHSICSKVTMRGAIVILVSFSMLLSSAGPFATKRIKGVTLSIAPKHVKPATPNLKRFNEFNESEDFFIEATTNEREEMKVVPKKNIIMEINRVTEKRKNQKEAGTKKEQKLGKQFCSNEDEEKSFEDMRDRALNNPLNLESKLTSSKMKRNKGRNEKETKTKEIPILRSTLQANKMRKPSFERPAKINRRKSINRIRNTEKEKVIISNSTNETAITGKSFGEQEKDGDVGTLDNNCAGVLKKIWPGMNGTTLVDGVLQMMRKSIISSGFDKIHPPDETIPVKDGSVTISNQTITGLANTYRVGDVIVHSTCLDTKFRSACAIYNVSSDSDVQIVTNELQYPDGQVHMTCDNVTTYQVFKLSHLTQDLTLDEFKLSIGDCAFDVTGLGEQSEIGAAIISQAFEKLKEPLLVAFNAGLKAVINAALIAAKASLLAG